VTVNSGGVVYFARFSTTKTATMEEEEEKEEEAAVFKYVPSKLAAQSEQLGLELAHHLGVATPQVNK
jgi:hypothetical protein